MKHDFIWMTDSLHRQRNPDFKESSDVAFLEKPFFSVMQISEKKTDDGWDANFFLPGFNKDEIEIKIEQENSTKLLIISAKSERELPPTLKREFKKTFLLTKDIDPDSAKATLENGILKIYFLDMVKYPKKIVTIE